MGRLARGLIQKTLDFPLVQFGEAGAVQEEGLIEAAYEALEIGQGDLLAGVIMEVSLDVGEGASPVEERGQHPGGEGHDGGFGEPLGIAEGNQPLSLVVEGKDLEWAETWMGCHDVDFLARDGGVDRRGFSAAEERARDSSRGRRAGQLCDVAGATCRSQPNRLETGDGRRFAFGNSIYLGA